MAYIPVSPTLFAIVDDSRHAALSKFKWRAVQHRRGYYARASFLRKGRRVSISMHRFVARTPRGMVCHHCNLNPLDNRRENLENMTKRLHDRIHSDNSLLILHARLHPPDVPCF